VRKYLIKRTLQIILTLFIYLVIVYIILQAQPGDIVDIYITNPKITKEAREGIRHQLGLDKPWHLQFLQYVKNMLTGNLGISFSHYPRPVWEIIVERLPRTVVLFLLAYIIYFFLGFQLGKIIAWRRKAAVDYIATITGVVLWTVFTPWWGLLIIWAFGFKLKLFPMGKFIDPTRWTFGITPNTVFTIMLMAGAAFIVTLSLTYIITRKLRIPRGSVKVALLGVTGVSVVTVGWLLGSTTIGYLARDILRHIVLPVFALTTIGFGGYMLMMRDSMLETIREDYIMAAKAKGLPEKVVRDKHAARNALLPIVTAFILALASVAEGGIITETIFSWPGIGLTMLGAILDEDMPLAVGAFVFFGIFLLVGHLVADILYAYLDPRIRYG